MQAVGNQVLAVILFSFIPIGLLVYALWDHITFVAHYFKNVFWPRQPERDPAAPLQPHHPRFGQGQCAICLQLKQLQVSATCGHSYCGKCLQSLFIRRDEKINCPLCRKIITTIFICFEASVQHPDKQAVINFVKYYNASFDDNRSIWRRITQFPYVWRMLRGYIFRYGFLIFFFRSIQFFKLIVFVLFYLLSPFDLIPESFFGIFGFLDDVIIGIVLLVFMILMAAVVYVRVSNR